MMKMKLNYLVCLTLVAFVFGSCVKDDENTTPVEPRESFIINYGNYTGSKSTITSFDKETGQASNYIYENVNGVAMTSNVQHACSFNSNIYFMGNAADEVFWVDAESFEQTENGISDDIVKPRYAVGKGDHLYVSCWGGDIWSDESLSYIAKVNLTTKSVEKKIALPGGPEGLAIVGNKLYAALNYDKKVAIINLDTEAISYIETPAVCSYFVKDDNGNLYVSLVSTYSDPSTETGLGYITTSNDQLEATYQLDGISDSYVNILAHNNDFSKIYVMTSAYDANWNLSGAIAVFDVTTKSFEDENLVEGVSGMNGLSYFNDKVFCFVAESVTANGKAVMYEPDGTIAGEFETGISPFMLMTAK
jgi:hypothetical protein